MIILSIKFQSNTPIFSKDIARKPFVLRTGQTDGKVGTDVRTDSGDTICTPPTLAPLKMAGAILTYFVGTD